MASSQKKLKLLGFSLIGLSILIVFFVYADLIFLYTKYFFSPSKENATVVVMKGLDDSDSPQTKARNEIIAPDSNFSIVIPKLNASSKIIANVDPFDSIAYQSALTQGIAHAEGTVFPGQPGNTFLFSHSSANLVDALKYNSDFYLLHLLKEGDEFFIVKNGKIYEYKVVSSKKVSADEVKYLDSAYIDEDLNVDTSGNYATLMTCWPPGTTLSRHLVIGKSTK